MRQFSITSLALMALGLPAWGTGYSLQRIITLGSSSVIPASQNNFTVLWCANSSTGACTQSVSGLNQSGSGAQVTNSSGYDIVFSATPCGSPTLMKWEVEKYVAATGEIEAWVFEATLTSGGVFYLCYGNSGISTFQGGAAGAAWNSAYKGIYHLPTTTVTDSTTNGNNATSNTASAVSVQIDGGVDTAAGTTEVLQSASLKSPTTALTVSAWAIFYSLTQPAYLSIVDFEFASPRATPFNSFVIGADWGTQTNAFYGYDSSGVHLEAGSSVSVNTPYHVQYTVSGTARTLYINGSVSASDSGGQTLAYSNGNLWFGTDSKTGDGFFNGAIDEVRISNVALSSNWIKTEYNNQSSPSTFYSVGSPMTPTTGTHGAAATIIIM